MDTSNSCDVRGAGAVVVEVDTEGVLACEREFCLVVRSLRTRLPVVSVVSLFLAHFVVTLLLIFPKELGRRRLRINTRFK